MLVLAVGTIVVLHLVLQILMQREENRLRIVRRLRRQRMQASQKNRMKRRVRFAAHLEDIAPSDHETTDGETDDDEMSNVSDDEPSTHDFKRLENELKSWMQKETQSSWTKPSPEAVANAGGAIAPVSAQSVRQETSLDDLFARQNVNMNAMDSTVLHRVGPDANPQDNLHRRTGGTLSSSAGTKAPSVAVSQAAPVRQQTTPHASGSKQAPYAENVRLKIAVLDQTRRGGGIAKDNPMNDGNLGNGLAAWDTMESTFAAIE